MCTFTLFKYSLSATLAQHRTSMMGKCATEKSSKINTYVYYPLSLDDVEICKQKMVVLIFRN